jgi:hypothetical protein
MKIQIEKYWWWDKFLAFDRGDKRRSFFDGNAAAAFHWELGRRNFPLKDYPAFNTLRRWEYDIAYIKLSRKFERWNPPVAVFWAGGPMINNPGFVAFSRISWNLRASKNALLNEFWKLIEQERTTNGIAEPSASAAGKGGKQRNANNANRTKGEGQPWRWLELLDLDLSNEPQRLDSNERSLKSQAKTKRDSIKLDFLELWKEIENHRIFLADFKKENPRAAKIQFELVKW